MGSPLHIKVLRTVPELEEVRRAWECWPGNRDSEIETFLTFLRSNPKTERPHVLVVYREGIPDAMLVGRIDRGKISCRLGYLQVSFKARIMCFVYGALRGNASRENCELIVDEILSSLSQGEADVAYMNQLRMESDICVLSARKPGLLSRDHVRVTQPHFAVRLPDTVERFYKGLSSGARWQVKSKQKKLVKDFAGEVQIKCFRETAEIEGLAHDAEQVAKTSYQRGLGVGFVDSEKSREQLRFKAQHGWLRGYVLYISDRPRAFWIGDINGDTFGSDYLAFDVELGKYSPGMFLITKVIEGFCDGNSEGVTGVDFGPGNAQYKESLSNQTWQETAMHIFAPSFKGISLNIIRSVIEGVDRAFKKALIRANLLQKIKKHWRAHARSKQAAQS